MIRPLRAGSGGPESIIPGDLCIHPRANPRLWHGCVGIADIGATLVIGDGKRNGAKAMVLKKTLKRAGTRKAAPVPVSVRTLGIHLG
jgi:hypothetical protein